MSIQNAVERQQGRPSLVQVVQRMQPEIARALPKHLDADRMARLALTVIRQTPKLAECDANSFAGALLTAAALGLEPGVNGEAYLVPYKRECQLIIGYQGMVKLFWQHPMAKHIDAQAVYEHDDFDYAYGLDPYLRHKPAAGERGKVVCYYAAAALTSGAKTFVVLSASEVKALRGGKVGTSGGVADPMHWMERKTVLRQLLKMLPKSTQLLNAIVVDEQRGSELSAHKAPEAIADRNEPVAEIEQQVPANIDQQTGEVYDEPPAGDEPVEGELVDWPAARQPGGGR